MAKRRTHFRVTSQIAVCIYLIIICLLPLWIVIAKINKLDAPITYFLFSSAWPVLAAALFWYTSRRCSSERLLFWDGLLYVNAATSIRWMYVSFFLGFFGVLIILISSAGIAIHGDIQRNPDRTKTNFIRLISFFYRNRMIQ
jgi:hypothetical protein